MPCAICHTRRPRRFCLGVHGDICSICCGTEREVTVDCPLDCEYLQESRRHDKPAEAIPIAIPNQDIRISEEFLREHEELLVFLGRALVAYSLATPGTIDFDVREALDALIRTYRTLESGVYYESLPPNPLAAGIYRIVQSAVEQFRTQEQQRLGMSRTRDTSVLGILVFLQRVELDTNNGRRRGRAFLDSLTTFYGSETLASERSPSSLILP